MHRRKLFPALALTLSLSLTLLCSLASLPARAQDATTKDAAKNAAKAAASSATTGVQEIDETALAKLLQRDAAAPRPLLVNFWATWCDPCREEFPDLVKINGAYASRGLDFILISLDDAAGINTSVPKFLEKMRAGAIPAYLLNPKDTDVAISTVDKAWQGEMPATFLFDRNGQLVFRHMGRIKVAELRAAIDKVLGGEATTTTTVKP